MRNYKSLLAKAAVIYICLCPLEYISDEIVRFIEVKGKTYRITSSDYFTREERFDVGAYKVSYSFITSFTLEDGTKCLMKGDFITCNWK